MNLTYRPLGNDLVSIAIASDPCRGLSQYRQAHIRVQKELVVSPASTGKDYCAPGRVF